MVITPTADADLRRQVPQARRTQWCAWLLVAATYLAASLVLHHRVLGDVSDRATGWTSSDSALFTWWLHWTPWALLHGENPLYSTWQHFPAGVNAMWNTTTPLLGLLLAPVTLSAGPTAAFNVGMIAGPVASGLACYAALRCYLSRWWPRAVAGGLYGFSPFVVAHTSVAHLNLVWALLPAALLWAVHTVLVQPRRPWWAGGLLGVAFAVQTGLYTQTVALAAVALAVVVIVLALRWPRQAWVRAPLIGRSAVACVVVYGVLCAYPLWLVLSGPGRPRAPIRDPATTGADAANLLVPTALTHLRGGTDSIAEQLRAHPGEQGSYLGVALLAVIVDAAIAVRSTTLRLAAAVGAVLAVASLGATLVVAGHDTGLVLPWRAALEVPLLVDAEASRLAPFVAACVAVVVALALDRAAHGRRWWAVALIGVAAVTWLPSNSQQTTSATSPQFFTAGAPTLLPEDVVVTWSRPSGKWVGGADPLLWQAASDMSYRMVGGYFIGADPAHDLLLSGPVTRYHAGAAGQPVDPMAARGDLVRRGVTAVVVVPQPDLNTPAVLTWTRQVTGTPGRLVGGVWVFRIEQ